jgi:DNA invertase Pin-like site-specific DNA recombinase
MNKITPDHLTRVAYVYIRQSTPDQLINNPESRRRQYALRVRAEALGWGVSSEWGDDDTRGTIGRVDSRLGERGCDGCCG